MIMTLCTQDVDGGVSATNQSLPTMYGLELCDDNCVLHKSR